MSNLSWATPNDIIMNFISFLEIALGIYLIFTTWKSKRNVYLKAKISIVFGILFAYGILGLFEIVGTVVIEMMYIVFLYFMVLLYKREGLSFYKKIENREKKSTDLMNALPVLIWEKDVDNKFVKANKACLNKLLLAKNITGIKGKTGVEIAGEIKAKGIKYTAGLICNLSDDLTKKEGKMCTFLEDFIIDGKPLFLLVYKIPLFSKSGKLLGTSGVGQDITEDVQEHKKLYEHYQKKQWILFEKLLDKHVNKFYFDGEGKKLMSLTGGKDDNKNI